MVDSGRFLYSSATRTFSGYPNRLGSHFFIADRIEMWNEYDGKTTFLLQKQVLDKCIIAEWHYLEITSKTPRKLVIYTS